MVMRLMEVIGMVIVLVIVVVVAVREVLVVAVLGVTLVMINYYSGGCEERLVAR